MVLKKRMNIAIIPTFAGTKFLFLSFFLFLASLLTINAEKKYQKNDAQMKTSFIILLLLLKKSVEKQVGCNIGKVTNVDNDLVEEHHFIDWFGEVECIWIQAGIIENSWELWLAVSEMDTRDDVDDIDTLTNENEGHSEFIPIFMYLLYSTWIVWNL